MRGNWWVSNQQKPSKLKAIAINRKNNVQRPIPKIRYHTNFNPNLNYTPKLYLNPIIPSINGFKIEVKGLRIYGGPASPRTSVESGGTSYWINLKLTVVVFSTFLKQN